MNYIAYLKSPLEFTIDCVTLRKLKQSYLQLLLGTISRFLGNEF
jgi:hypothetical protein